ncbi:MAG: flagellar export chaperone FlgN [Phycisphaerales bacterium]
MGAPVEGSGPRGRDASWADRLGEILEEQASLYAILDRLSEQQGALLDPEHADTLLRVLAERDAIIARLTELNGEARPHVGRWDAGGAGIGDGARERIRSRLDEINGCMARITERDASHFATLQENRDRVSRELGGTNNARAAVSAYGRAGASRGGARYQDREV